jgi:hypothetical protein
LSGRPGSYGYIGINNELPQSHLDVRGTAKVLASATPQTGAVWNGTSSINGFEASTTTTGDAWVGIQRSGSGAALFLTKSANANNGDRFLQFTINNSSVGSINYTGSGVNYVTTSDQRLKENIRSTKFGLDALKSVRVYDYNFKADANKTLSTGVLAQELHSVYPQAVTEGGADAKTNPWQVDYSKLVPMLVKSVQELSDQVEALKGEKAQLSAELNERVSQIERLLGTQQSAKSGSSFSSSRSSVSK